MPQAKTGMDFSSEISKVTVIRSDLDHLETEEEDEEETEAADEVDEDISIGGEDRTAGNEALRLCVLLVMQILKKWKI